MIDILHFAGFYVHNYEPRARLGIADLGAEDNVFSVSRFGNKVWHDDVLRARSRLDDCGDYVFAVRRKSEIANVLPSGQIEWFALLTLLAFFLLLFALFGALAH